MRSFHFSSLLLAAASIVSATPSAEHHEVSKRGMTIAPKVFIIDMFEPEGAAWWGIDEFDVLAQNITLPGLSPLFPEVHCTADGDICQIITGESEINAASSISALVLSDKFDLTKTYFFVAGIAGVNPEVATTGSVTLYEFDIRDLPDNFTTGYIPFSTENPADYPGDIYGTEVFELNLALRDVAMAFASTAALNDTADAAAYRAKYASEAIYAAAAKPPSVVGCDVATSDVYYSGTLLSEAFENTTRIWTNGSGVYCSTAQEDNATLEAILRAAKANMTDYSRVIVMRTSSDFDRPPPGISEIQNLLYVDQGGFSPAIENIYLAGIKVVMGILEGWDSTFAAGIVPNNYVGDIFDTLGGTPDYGLPSYFISKRDVEARAPEGNLRMRRAQHSAERRAAIMNEV
ncbi:hypothetical protein LTR10_013806 [Elasticomyces elasticus]|uniref:Purine nucleoside permease n=1 Tax=Exophiala sideris TaxID=1016849 RepID=A0ABR0JGC7_9EURO|nr:hypothetical protein LTR10_013806 [Elasticomyces elasticus]KAK5033218.1 hypothetical protein LTS07_003519 [Exophiala sideris]KAK5042284.1 hypothetical protein LTR13_002090 [Exophiala sideris]KAK5063762.1 hypothetical protein LTR69_003527 [Exophiala sideris]KAK5185552.1 hypothetical protein LTR44_002541 [Eurotiomycetes sp. CCFEE 6388]